MPTSKYAATAWVALLCANACVTFDDYPLGDLCANAIRDAQGRAIHYPESRVCNMPQATPDAGDEADGGAPMLIARPADGGSL